MIFGANDYGQLGLSPAFTCRHHASVVLYEHESRPCRMGLAQTVLQIGLVRCLEPSADAVDHATSEVLGDRPAVVDRPAFGAGRVRVVEREIDDALLDVE